jgi:3-oxoacyl-[acyl-carrier-protein] synthase II
MNGESARTYYGGVVENFDGKVYVTPRKALKVMNREVQTAYSAAHLAWQDAGLTETALEPSRLGVVYGSEMLLGEISDFTLAIANSSEHGEMQYERWGAQFSRDVFPLWMLKNLPNMPACHVGIAINAQGPNNSIVQEEISGLQALIEACMIMQRNQADIMMVGAVGGRVGPGRLAFRHPALYRTTDAGEEYACTPFDAKRAGIVPGEAAAAIVIEKRSHAVRRGANILAEVVGFANRFAKPSNYGAGSDRAIANAIDAAMHMAHIDPSELAVIAAQGYSSPQLDIQESRAIQSRCGQTPVTAFSSYFGTTGASCGLIEMIAGVLATSHGVVLPTLGFAHPDSDCPVNVITQKVRTQGDYVLKLSFTPYGHAAAVVIRCNSLNS